MKLAILFAVSLLSSPAFAGTLYSCGNSKLTVNVTEGASADGKSMDTAIEMNYVDWKGTLQGTFNSEDPSFQPDAQGFRAIYVNGPREDTEFFTGKFKINTGADTTISLDGNIQIDGGEPLPVHGTYICGVYAQ